MVLFWQDGAMGTSNIPIEVGCLTKNAVSKSKAGRREFSARPGIFIYSPEFLMRWIVPKYMTHKNTAITMKTSAARGVCAHAQYRP